MRTFQVTVNGNTYVVDVEETTSGAAPVAAAPAAPAAAPKAAPAPAAKPAAPKKAESAFKIYQVSDELPYYLL